MSHPVYLPKNVWGLIISYCNELGHRQMTRRVSKELTTQFVNKYFREPYRKKQQLLRALHRDCQALYDYQFGNKRPQLDRIEHSCSCSLSCCLFWEEALNIRKEMIRMYDEEFEISYNTPPRLSTNGQFVIWSMYTGPFDGIRHYRMELQDLYHINAGELTQKINKTESDYLVLKSRIKRETRCYQRQFRKRGYCRYKLTTGKYQKQSHPRHSKMAQLESRHGWHRRAKPMRYNYHQR